MKLSLFELERAQRVLTQLGVEPPQEIADAINKYVAVSEWLQAEANWSYRVRQWLAAEARHNSTHLSGQAYVAARKGWDQWKTFVPNLDGVDVFEQLPEALQFRYAAFASAILDVDCPVEVKSQKQIARA